MSAVKRPTQNQFKTGPEDSTPRGFFVSTNNEGSMPTTEEILKERGERYGKFANHAAITQALKAVMLTGTSLELSEEVTSRIQSRVSKMESDQVECLEMAAHKIGRILNGDPNYGDSWRDIAGYFTLVADRLEGVQEHLAKQTLETPEQTRARIVREFNCK